MEFPKYIKPIIGQPVITTHGFGKVTKFIYSEPTYRITVKNDIDGYTYEHMPEDVKFIEFTARSFKLCEDVE